MNNSNEQDVNLTDKGLSYDSDISHVVNLVCQSILFIIGSFFHYKIINVYNVEKSKTWLNQIYHAVVTVILFGFRIPFQAITHFIPNLAGVSGSWICYFGAFVSFYGFNDLRTHSLWIAMEKYIFIVHTLKARVFGEEKIGKIFVLLNATYLTITSILAMLTSNYVTKTEIISCFGIGHESLKQKNSSTAGISDFFFCDVSGYSETSLGLAYTIQFVCGLRSFVNIVVGTNAPEAFIYYKIFKHMER